MNRQIMLRLFALTALTVAVLFTGAHAIAQTKLTAPTETDTFEASGHEYEVDFGGGRAFRIVFTSDRELIFTKLQEPNKGFAEIVHFTYKKLRAGLYLLYWQEASKNTVVLVEDFEQGISYSNLTKADGTFINSSSKLTKIK